MSIRRQKIYHKAKLTRRIDIRFNELGNNIEEILLHKLTNLLEGKCNVEGYFKKKSIKLLSYSSGQIVRGDVLSFELLFEALVCLPVEEMVIKPTVKNVTKAGIRASLVNEDDDPLVVFIVRDHFNKDDYFNSIEVDNMITVKIIGVRYEINDEKIYVIGELVKPKKLKVKI